MSDKGRAIALGFFDGVHIGHKALLNKTNERAQEMDLIPSVINFDIHPDSLVFGKPVDLIYSSLKRTEILRDEFNISDIIMIHFNRELMTTPWDTFLSRLASENGLKWIVVGYDFKFGYKGLGTAEKIKRFCEYYGIGIDVIPPVQMNGKIVSSSLIRSCIVSGDIKSVNEMLGREYSIQGSVIHGMHLGTKIGYPTINISIPHELAVPSFGVYATRTLIKGIYFDSITNIGIRPTFYTNSEIVMETHLLHCFDDLYGEYAEMFFHEKIRDEIKFSNSSELISQISEDIKIAENYFEKK